MCSKGLALFKIPYFKLSENIGNIHFCLATIAPYIIVVSVYKLRKNRKEAGKKFIHNFTSQRQLFFFLTTTNTTFLSFQKEMLLQKKDFLKSEYSYSLNNHMYLTRI